MEKKEEKKFSFISLVNIFKCSNLAQTWIRKIGKKFTEFIAHTNTDCHKIVHNKNDGVDEKGNELSLSGHVFPMEIFHLSMWTLEFFFSGSKKSN